VTALTSSFGDPTRREIYLFVHDCSNDGGDGATAAEVAARFDLHPNVARHHLDKLAGGGHVEVATERSRTGAGRPSKRYRCATPDMSFDLPIRHDDLLVTLLGKSLSLLPDDKAEAMAEEVGIEYGRRVAAAMGGDLHKSFRAALHAVADALSAHGFAAHAERHRGELRIVSEHCPFGDAAIEHPVICAVDRGLVQGMLSALYGETNAETQASRPMGADRCVTSIV
jgi:predicted ArsR family transcriptional regulator